MIKGYPKAQVIVDAKGETKVQLEKGIRFSFKGKKHFIGAGFVCDGASIPRAFWRIVGHPLEGKVLPAAIIHDFCYQTACVSRYDADYIFYSTMREFEVPFVKRCAIWLAVRLFGGFHYGRTENAA